MKYHIEQNRTTGRWEICTYDAQENRDLISDHATPGAATVELRRLRSET